MTPAPPTRFSNPNQNSYSVAVSATPTNGGTVAGGGAFSAGTSRTVTATANSGYTFTNWTEAGKVVSSAASYTFSLTANRNLVANFNAGNYTIAVSAPPAPAVRSPAAAHSRRALHAPSPQLPTAATRSSNWTENGAVVASAASYTFTINGNRNLVANSPSIP